MNNSDPNGDMLITTAILIGSAIIGASVALYTGHKMRSAGYDWADTLFYSAGAGVCAFCTAYSFGMSAYGLYCAYSAYQGVAPVTQIGTSSANSTSKSPYLNLVDPPNVAPGKDFTAKQKNQIIEQNKINNNGVVR